MAGKEEIEELGAGPAGFSRVRCGKAEGLARRIDGRWRAFGWWTGVDEHKDTYVENERVPPWGGQRRPAASKLLPKLEGMDDKKLKRTLEHGASIFEDPEVADYFAERPELALRCITGGRSSR